LYGDHFKRTLRKTIRSESQKTTWVEDAGGNRWLQGGKGTTVNDREKER